MRGSLYPNGVTVDQVALRRTELSKAQEILRNRVDWTCRGVFSGGLVTVNLLDDTRIDIMQASGFAPNGEYVETDSPYYSIALADYAVGVVNYVCLVYTEVDSYRQPHESDGQRYYTRAAMAWRVRVYSAAQYALLPASDENLANDSQDRIIFFSKVTANGVGISLTPSSITSPRSFNNIMYTVPRKCVTILGIDILSASSGSPLGAGTLTYDFTPGTPPTYQLTWSTSNGAGAPVAVAADGNYTLLDGAGEFITVKVALTVLPTFVVATTVTETITIFNLYYQEMPRLSAEDHLHRNYIGTGTISPQNPHGNSLDDFSGETLSMLDEHQDVLHCNGIWRGSASSIFQITVLTAPVADTFNLVAPAGGDLYYVNGIKLDSIDISVGVSILPPVVQGAYFYEICVSDEATVECNKKAAYPAVRAVTGTWIVDMSRDYPFGSFALTCTTTPGPFTPRVFTWDGGKPVTFTPLSDPSQAIRLYSADGEHWIDLWVNTNPSVVPDEALPTAPGTVTDTITVFSSLTDGSNQFMQIGALSYWYDATSVKWVLGYHPLAANRNAVDKRIWGNTGTENMATWALEDLAYLPNNELGRSGALLRRNGAYNEFQYTYGGAGFNISVNGGSFYCRGQRISVKSTQSLIAVPSAVQLIWADMAGVYHILNVTGTFGGDLQAAMRYVLGSTQNIPSVSDFYHYSDAGDAPERGILLYCLVTDATDIDPLGIVDFTQNVNRVDDPWSVGSRISTTVNAVHAQAAYDNFFTAFEYAKYSMYGTENKGSVTLTVIGTVEVGFKVTQPEYVNVRGTRGVSIPYKSIVRVTGTDAWGSWLLSFGCKVSNLSVYNTSTTLPAIGLNHYATVEECFFVSSGGEPFRASASGALSCNGVVLRNNISSGSALISSVSLANGYTGWIITGNEVLAVPSDSRAAIQLLGAEKLLISGNIIDVPNSNDQLVNASGGIRVGSSGFQCQDVTIRDNYISVGNNAAGQLNSVAGIHLQDVWFATVSGNTVRRSSGSVTQIGVGLYLEGLLQSSVVDNKIAFMGGGIYIVGYLYETEISRNKMQGLFHSGISAFVNDFPVLNMAYGVRVDGNDVYMMPLKGLTGGLFTSADLFGVAVYFDLTPANSSLSGVSVSKNCVSGIGSILSGASVYGIMLGVNGGTGFCRSLSIDDNVVNTLDSSIGDLVGINVYVSGMAQAAEQVSLSRNHVTFAPKTTSPTVMGIYTAAHLIGSSINNNTSILESSDDTAEGIALYSGVWQPSNTTVSGNILLGLSAGAYIIASSSLKISDNIIYGKGGGLHVGGAPTKGTLVQGNRIQVDAYIESPYAPDAGWVGAHCLSVDLGASGITLRDNFLYLNGVDRPGAGVNDVPDGSTCVTLVDLSNVCIDGCSMYSDTATVDNTDGTGAVRGYLCLCRAGHSGAGKKTTITVTDCIFDDRVEAAGTSRTPLYGLYIIPDFNFKHDDGDVLCASIKGNTFFTSNTDRSSTYHFNEEGRPATATPAPAFRPYVIYVPSTYGLIFADTRSHVYFVGNSIHGLPLTEDSRPYVYMCLHEAAFGGGILGHCIYEPESRVNFVNQNGEPFPTPDYAWAVFP